MKKKHQLQPQLFRTELEFRDLAILSDIHVRYRKDARHVVCFCGKKVERSILPHLREKHPKVWGKWCSIFVTLRNRKWSTKRIMNAFRANGKFLFTWTVIEKELRRMEETGQGELKVWQKDKIKSWRPPEDFGLQKTTVWDFPSRGDWSVHQSDYRGNWPPQLARNLILSYTKKGDWVADLFAGGGTTLIECWLTGRKSVGLDIRDFAIKTTNARLDEMDSKSKNETEIILNSMRPIVKKHDSRQCDQAFEQIGLVKNSISLICAHPPYLDALRYTEAAEGDLSRLSDETLFVSAMHQVFASAKPWLKPGGIFALLVGDIRRKGKLIPLGFLLKNAFVECGYELREIIIKTQNQDQSSNLWANNGNLKFRIAHEYLLVFSNPIEETRK